MHKIFAAAAEAGALRRPDGIKIILKCARESRNPDQAGVGKILAAAGRAGESPMAKALAAGTDSIAADIAGLQERLAAAARASAMPSVVSPAISARVAHRSRASRPPVPRRPVLRRHPDLLHFDLRDALAADIRAGRAQATADGLFARAVSDYGIEPAEAAEHVERMMHRIDRDRARPRG